MSRRNFHFPYPINTLHFAWSRSTLFALAIFISAFTNGLSGQSIRQLERNKTQLEDRIALTRDLLDQNETNQQDAFQNFQTIEEQVLAQQELIQIYERFISLSDSSQIRSKEVIAALQNDLIDLKEEYSIMMRVGLRQKLTDSKVLFLLSAENFSDVFRRWQFLKRYNETRHRQIQNIQGTQRVLVKKIGRLEEQKLEKIELLKSLQTETEKLNESLAKRDAIFDKLKNSSKNLASKLEEQEQSRTKLAQRLTDLVKKAEAAEKQATAKTPTNQAAKKKQTSNKGVSFASQKGKLDWPVKEGLIIKKFGKQPHPTLKGILINNNGIDIACRAGVRVTAVQAGTVAQIYVIPGAQHTVVVQHGDYYTVYSNLEQVAVSQGSELSTGELVGKLGAQHQGPLHFEVWHKKIKQNPQRWIKRK